jgi:predicted amidohydrolase YtcJ
VAHRRGRRRRSDWSASSLDRLAAIQVAVTRRDPQAPAGPAWLPEQRITLAEALATYTINGARLNFEERDTGSIEVGKAADLVVLDRNLFAIPAEQIHAAKVRYTFLDGREVYAAPRR